MPSRKDTMKFIVDNDLKSQLKGFSKNSINELVLLKLSGKG